MRDTLHALSIQYFIVSLAIIEVQKYFELLYLVCRHIATKQAIASRASHERRSKVRKFVRGPSRHPAQYALATNHGADRGQLRRKRR